MNREQDLLSRFDEDPGRWRPMFYNLEIDVPVAADESGVGSVALNNQPYIWKALRHTVVGQLDYTLDYTGSGLKNDGQYSIEFRDENSNYQNMAGMANTMFGSEQFWCDFPMPIPYNGNRIITFRVTNRYARVLDPLADYFAVALTLAGVADWGTVQTQRP